MAEPKYDVFVVADLCIDLLFTGSVRPRYGQEEQFIDDYTVDLGGSAAIFASQFAKLGGRVGLLGKVGPDVFGRILLDKLREVSIPTDLISVDTASKTAAGIGLSDGHDRAMLTYMGTLDSISPRDIRAEFLTQTRHWHIASFFLLKNFWAFWPTFLQQIKAQGITLSLDTNWAPEGNWAQVRDILHFMDVFLPNEEEARHISGEKNLIEAGHWLASHGPLVVIKCGADGAKVFQNGQVLEFAVPDELKQNLTIADTTGAGDNFDAGFLRHWLLGDDLETCVQWGMRCGTSSLSGIGGISGQVRID